MKLKIGDTFRCAAGGLILITRKPRMFSSYYDISTDGQFNAYGDFRESLDGPPLRVGLKFNHRGDCLDDSRYNLIELSRNTEA